VLIDDADDDGALDREHDDSVDEVTAMEEQEGVARGRSCNASRAAIVEI
jgi:hypothetical protein